MKLLFDLHTHTTESGHAYCTLMENINCGKQQGLLAYGVSEHAPAMPGTVSEMYFINFKVIPKEIDGIRILCGVEANIIDYDGNIDCSELICSKVDYMIASMHSHCIPYGTVEENTRALIGAMENPIIKIIGHPDDSRYPIDYDQVVQAAVRTDTILELNNSSLHPLSARKNGLENIKLLISKCVEYGAKMIVNSDAHFCFDVGTFDAMEALLEEMNVPEGLIINTDISGLDYVLIKR
ncbi:phosphatase [Chakrabartyella piscis]|uniref:phosphatase n=1 Tax=Chakrabartyella piscis TaxID=2918914 RepID=UPI0029583C5B|nr:phosphatase [Chakrabartyella piscis]